MLSFSLSVQDLFNAPATEQKIKALFERLEETIAKASSQGVFALSQTHGQVPQALPQRCRGHGLGKRTLGMHGSRRQLAHKRGKRKMSLTNTIGLSVSSSWDLLHVTTTFVSSIYNLLHKVLVASIQRQRFLCSSLVWLDCTGKQCSQRGALCQSLLM